ncbi:metal ABC transporter substrate-binding protein [Blastococcus saxobsidens]|uniref:ABC-type metal ion transport system, surface component n=1 Tax=Blastococcus saxobsidens (strain DD2) TaxID=1146883 RepID=H6RLG0_BLASD|nr:metal ABC transporter substrate-binding protein [Blastococcus saxobsidens]CCG02486.1 ABC-type metal ion transport system, surface component [Blastococcus saxobsidens DD2]
MNTSVVRRTAAASAAATLLLLAGCGGSDASAPDDGRLDVVAGFYPLEWAAERVGGDLVSVSSLTAPGGEPHDLELTPQDVAGVSDADLLVYLSGFQPAVDDAAESQAGDSAWDAAEAADLSLTSDGSEHAGEQHAEEEHADDEAAADPHFWLDPLRLAAVGDALADRLAELDPDNAQAYAGNAAALRADLEALDVEMAAALGDCRVDTLVTSHDAFGYLADRYGLDVVGISGLSPDQETSADQLAEIATLVGERGVTTVYTETLVDPALAETVADEAGVRTAVLDPIEGLTDESAGEDYLEVMRSNLATLAEGQSCS